MFISNDSHPSLIASSDDFLIAKSWINKYEWYKNIFEDQKKRIDAFVSKSPIYVSPVKQTYQYKMYNCPNHDVELLYEEEYPHEHHCPMDSKEVFTGFKYDSAWSGWYNRKLATNLVWMGLLYNIYGDIKYAGAGKEILLKFADLYLKYPVDNTILGPAHVFFGTLSESFWGVDMAYGYDLLFNYDGFTAGQREKIKNGLFYPLANVTQQFPESASNRQLWYNNVSAAVGFIYNDEKLIDFAMNGKYGFKWQLGSALPESGFWGEGPGYHFVTLRGMIHFAEMCMRNGIDLYHMEVNGRTMQKLFDAPFKLMKPNYEFPRIKDSGGGNLLDYSTFYEVAYSVYGDQKYLAVLNKSNIKRGTQVVAEESGKGERETPITLFQLNPELPLCSDDIYPEKSDHLKGNGLAVLRTGNGEKRKHLFLDYGIVGGEHGHPDRLQIGYYANGKNWIVDPLNESYFNPNLQTWFRQTIAHNTIVINETTQAWANGYENFFGETTLFQAASGYSKDIYPGAKIDRTVLQLNEYFIDFTQIQSDDKRVIDYPIHSFGKLKVEGIPLEEATLDAFGVMPGLPGYDQLTEIFTGVTDKPVNFIFTEKDNSGLLVKTLMDGDTTIYKCINPPIGGFYKQMIKEQLPQPMFFLRKHASKTLFINLFHVFDSEPQITKFDRKGDNYFSITASGFDDQIYADFKKSEYSVVRIADSKLEFAAGFNVSKIQKDNKVFLLSKKRLEKIQLKISNNSLYIDTIDDFGELRIIKNNINDVIVNGTEIEHSIEGDYILIKEKKPVTVDLSSFEKILFKGRKNILKIVALNTSSEKLTVPVKLEMAKNWRELVKSRMEWWGGIVNLIPGNIKQPMKTESPVYQVSPISISANKDQISIAPNSSKIIKFELDVPIEAPLTDYPFEFSIGENTYDFELSIEDPLSLELIMPNMKQNLLRLILKNNTGEKLFCNVALDGKANWSISKTNISETLLPGKESIINLNAKLTGYNDKQEYPIGITVKSGEFIAKKTRLFNVTLAHFTHNHPSLSGDWSGWNKSTPLLINREDQVCKLLMGNQKWNGPDDMSAEIYCMYDKKFMYIGADVKDDVVISHWNYPEMSYPWDADSIEFVIDTRTTSEQGFDPPTPGMWRHLMLAEYRKTDFAKWRFGSAGGPTLPKPNLLKDAETFFKKTEKGYQMICRIPITNFGKNICKSGCKVGFDIGVNDNDGTSFRKNFHIWSGYTQNQVWWVMESIGALVFE